MWSPTYSSDELYHHGILGMKWGVRRYQNEDGTLTSAGRKHLGIKERVKNARVERKAANHYNYRDSDQYKSADRQHKAYQTNMHNTLNLL